jgi:hypothetical protein
MAGLAIVINGSPGYRPGWKYRGNTEQRNEAKRLSSDGSPGNGAGYVLASSQMAVLVIEMVNVCGSSLMAVWLSWLEIQRKYRGKE